MHGVKRSRTTSDQVAKEAVQLAKYQAVESVAFANRKSKVYNEESLVLTRKMLSMNPELYTIWNYRREILSSLGKDLDQQILKDDIEFTQDLLQRLPKVYWIWNHRIWCLDQLSLTFPSSQEDGRKWEWREELGKVEMMLKADSRNFHAWDYRRHVLTSLYVKPREGEPLPIFPEFIPGHVLKDELSYTSSHISKNFSNFSAWHQRTKVFPQYWSIVSDSAEVKSKNIDEEFELVRQALWTEPADQSGWLYHRWLSSLLEGKALTARIHKEVTNVEELLDLEPDSKWCLDSLVHYKMILLKQKFDIQIKTQILDHLERLQSIDPDRKKRYQDIAAEVGQ